MKISCNEKFSIFKASSIESHNMHANTKQQSIRIWQHGVPIAIFEFSQCLRFRHSKHWQAYTRRPLSRNNISGIESDKTNFSIVFVRHYEYVYRKRTGGYLHIFLSLLLFISFECIYVSEAIFISVGYFRTNISSEFT